MCRKVDLIINHVKDLINVENHRSQIGKNKFTRNRCFSFEICILSFLLLVNSRFSKGDGQIIALLFADGFFGKHKKVPSKEAYHKAIEKIPSEVINGLIETSHNNEFEEKGILYHGMDVVIVDGTMIRTKRSNETIETFGLSKNQESESHYPHSMSVGFFELSTCTFKNIKIKKSNTAERKIALEEAMENKKKLFTYMMRDITVWHLSHCFLVIHII